MAKPSIAAPKTTNSLFIFTNLQTVKNIYNGYRNCFPVGDRLFLPQKSHALKYNKTLHL
ncbi:hypothetical protein SAMN05421741_12325 [Paenimyroides ummariense]|uniref:Uncharacterized protein n=1 Tax=Paenimyroides ummariense TaxID=913024 RepID=A0A1I5EXP7_9FLAO|nr:hypothetical protein [Paenimyroides ummariense]SFO16160.1 hypothetical protein SAMN05421741_12325 [Paenimyroides ummariense]